MEEASDSKREGKKFVVLDPLLSEDMGVWIPVSVPPMSESEHDRWVKDAVPGSDYFSEGGEPTMWDVVAEMLLAARGKLTRCRPRLSWMSDRLLHQAWQEMAQTLHHGDEEEDCNRGILDAEPPSWVPDSSALSCMLCGTRFHAIMSPRHHCRFCGGVFCGDCSRGKSLLPVKFGTAHLQRSCDVCFVRLESVQPHLMGRVSRAARPPSRDLTDLSTLRSWLNFPWSQSMEDEIYKATNIIHAYHGKVGCVASERRIPNAILRRAKGLAILTVARVGAMMVTYGAGSGLVVARRGDGSWSPPCAISSFGVGWGPQVGGELIDYMVVLPTEHAVRVFTGTVHVAVGAGFSVAVGVFGRAAEAHATAAPAGACCYTYSSTKGAFVGCSLKGTVFSARNNENSRFYGSPAVTPSEILLRASFPAPPSAAPLYRSLSLLYQRIHA